MDSILKSDIFFVVATVALIVLTVLFSIALVYAIRALRLIYASSKVIKTKVTQVANTIEASKNFVKKATMVELIGSLFTKKQKGTKKHTHN